MSKIGGGSVKAGGGITQEGLDALLEEPTQNLRERTPQSEPLAGSPFEQGENLLDEPQVGEAFQQEPLPYEEQQVQESQIPNLKERAAQAPERVDRYHPQGAPVPTQQELNKQQEIESVFGPNGGLNRRAGNLIKKVESGEIGVKGINTPTTIVGQPTTINPVATQIGALDPNTQNFSAPFLGVMSYVTENFFAEKAAGKQDVLKEQDQRLKDEGVDLDELDPTGKNRITKAEGSEQLGRQLAQDWGKLNGQEPVQLSKQDATVLGDLAKEMYYRNVKDMGLMEFLPGKQGEQGAYFITQLGNSVFGAGKAERAKYFPKEHVRPTKTPTKSGQQVGDKKGVTKNITGKIKNGETGLNEGDIDQARKNFNKVGNIVEKQRMRILFSTILPVLQQPLETFIGDNADPLMATFASINNFGQDKFDSFVAKQAGADAEYDPVGELNQLRKTVAQSVYGIAKERNGVNFLTYDIQAFNGRLSPQQTHFNPTTSKAVRFVTANPTPVRISRGSRQDRNIRQMYAMMLVPKKYGATRYDGAKAGVDALLPAGRESALQEATPELLQWGRRLTEVLANGMTDAEAEAIAAAIEQGMPLTDPNFPQIKALGLDPQKDADLIKEIASKGEDGPHFIDGLIDFVKYHDNLAAGKPHHSFFNAYIDGKTNGIASNGIQMGDENVALRTGVTRSPDSPFAVDQEKDIRAELADVMTEALADIMQGATDMNGFDGGNADSVPHYKVIADRLYSNKGVSRDLHKKMTMTFGYGKEIDSFKNDIMEAIQEIAVNDPAVATSLKYLQDGGADVGGTFNAKYTEGMYQVMSPKGIEATKLLKGSALAFAFMDELMTMTSHTGMELRFGGNVFSGDVEETQSYAFKDDKGKVTVRHYEGAHGTSAAPKMRTDAEGNVHADYGGKAWGGAVPGPVQSLDAATVAMTVTGKSWERLTRASQGNPYIHSIYDAFKMDANGYDVILEEVNNNWLNAAAKWSYLEQTRDSLREAQKKFFARFGGLPKNKPINLAEEFPFLAQLLSTDISQKGATYPKTMLKKLNSILPKEVDAWETLQDLNKMTMKSGINLFEPPAELTPKQIMQLYNDIMYITGLAKRLTNLIDKTNKDKAKLIKKIKASGPVLQYYAH